MKPEQIIERTKLLAVNIVRMTNELPKIHPSQILSNQVIRAGTSVGANYRAACRSKSTKDFIYKLKVVEEELDEIIYWLDIIAETHLYLQTKIASLKDESTELIKIIGKSISTAKKNYYKKRDAA